MPSKTYCGGLINKIPEVYISRIPSVWIKFVANQPGSRFTLHYIKGTGKYYLKTFYNVSSILFYNHNDISGQLNSIILLKYYVQMENNKFCVRNSCHNIEQVQFRLTGVAVRILSAQMGSAYHIHGGVMVQMNAMTTRMKRPAQV